MSKLAAALAGGGNLSYEDAYDKEALTQSRIAQALATVRQADAAAAAHQAKANQDNAETAVLQGRPGLFEEQVANASGLDVPTVQGYRQRLRTGVAPQVPMGPEAPDGSMGVGSMQIPAEAQTKLAQALKQFMPLLANMKDMKPDDLAKADQIYGDTGLRDQVLAGTLPAGRLGAAQAAREGKPLFRSGAGGEVLGLFDGAVDTSNPMAQSTIGLKGAQAAQAKAGAADHYASAGQHNAAAAKLRMETAQGASTGALQVVPADDGTINIVNKATGQARPAIGADGKPFMGKGKDLNTEQANALTFGSRMQAANDVLMQLATKGVMTPGNTKLAANAVPGWAGGGLAQAAANAWVQSPEQQQVEQAQRDFINAVLRRESGAAISMGEFSNAAQQYFPQPGDKPAVIEQKRQARERVIAGMLEAVPASRRTVVQPAPAAPATPRQGGASGGWGDAPAGRNVVVNY
jgi:hypothetical protein